jgi:phosphoribosyl 1,2-cyclic phosphate phosphodiesterase
MKILVLGCGDSKGVPKLGCKCRVCRETAIKNRRTRPSVLLKYNRRNILIDASPDFKEQVLKNNIKKINALLLTHNHADHVLGFEDLFYFVKEINKKDLTFPVYGSENTLKGLKKRFIYLFEDKRLSHINFKLVKIQKIFSVFNLRTTPIKVFHGDYKELVFGYLFEIDKRKKVFAYIPDGIEISKNDFKKLFSVDLLIIGVSKLTHTSESYQSCFSLEQIVKLKEILKPKHCFLTHLPHSLDYYQSKLPKGIRMCYDGMRIKI